MGDYQNKQLEVIAKITRSGQRGLMGTVGDFNGDEKMAKIISDWILRYIVKRKEKIQGWNRNV